MRLRSFLCICFTAFGLAAPAAASAPAPLRLLAQGEFFGYSANFKLQGTNGYELGFFAFSERRDGRGRIFVGIGRDGGKKNGAFYGAPAIVSEAFVKADLGALGKVDLALRPSGREKTIHVKCSSSQYPFEPGVYEGIVEFKGEGGYTRARETSVPLQPPITSFCGGGSGSGESSGPGASGARIRGLSFANDRKLSFQVNKNHERGRVLFSAEIRERRDGVLIHRAVEGFAPAGSFRFDPELRTARLALPVPFSGAASLVRDSDSLLPRWFGSLAVDFLGRPNVRLASPGIHVSLVHACFTRSNKPEAASC